MVNLPIYLDNHATTRVDPRVVEAMRPYFTEIYGNAGSTTHAFGSAAKDAVDEARAKIAAAIGAKAKEIVLTSGATESNNLAIRGVAEKHAARGRHIISVTTEHPAVLDPLAKLAQRGFEVTLLPVIACARPAGRPDSPRSTGRGHPRRHDPGLGHAGQQRDRGHPALGRDRAVVQTARRAAAHRCHAGRGQDPGRRRSLGRRSHELHGPQDLRAQGHRRPVRSQPRPPGAPGAADRRRRAGRRAAERHGQRAGHRRFRPGPGALSGGASGRSGPLGRPPRPALRRAERGPQRRRAQRSGPRPAGRCGCRAT